MSNIESIRKSLDKLERKNAQAIADIRKNIKNLDEPTYSIGDRFKYCGNKYILISTAGNSAVMGSLEGGWRYGDPEDFVNSSRITQAEFKKAYGVEVFTRYWDSREKILSQ